MKFNSYRASSVPRNRKYRRFFQAAEKRGYLSVAVEFPIVGPLNNYLGEKPKTASLFNFYKWLFVQGLNRDSVLSEKVLRSRAVPVTYADFKSLGVVFSEDTPEIRQALLRLKSQVTKDFVAVIRELPEIVELENSGRSILQNPHSWTQWGLGKNPLQATVAARVGKFQVPPLGEMPPLEYRDPQVQDFFLARFQGVETVRQTLENQLEKEGLLTHGFTTRLEREHQRPLIIPSERLFAVLKSLSQSTHDDYLSDLSEKLKIEFGTSPSRSVLMQFQRYFHYLDSFQPKIDERQEGSVETVRLSHGALYLDVRGQTARNLFQVAASLAEAAEHSEESVDLVGDLARALRLRQKAESKKFERIRTDAKSLAYKLGYLRPAQVSGDEIVVAIPSTADADFAKLVVAISEDKLPLRAVEMQGGSGHFYGSHVARAEELEKRLRVQLREVGYSVDDLNALAIGTEVTPTGPTSANFRLLVASASNPPLASAVERKIQQWVTEHKFELAPGYKVKDLANAHNQAPLPERLRHSGVTEVTSDSADATELTPPGTQAR